VAPPAASPGASQRVNGGCGEPLSRLERKQPDGRYYLDFGANRRIWSLPVGKVKVPFDRRLANRTIERIRDLVSHGKSLDEALAGMRPAHAEPNLVLLKFALWLELKAAEVEAGDRSPTYLRTLKHYAKPDGVLSWWTDITIHEVTYAALEDWSLWLSKRGLSPKSRRNILGVFRSFVGWLFKRHEIDELPRDWPWPKVSPSISQRFCP
jgi:hypothetical protein